MPRYSPLLRKGFTLVELLVVLAILLLLMAMLLPAIQRVRESANKMVCASHLRQIGQAVQLYLASNNQLFPSGGGDNPNPRTLNTVGLPTLRVEQDWGWMYQILPYMEQDPLWRLRSPSAPVASYFDPSYGIDPVADAQIVATPIEAYFCPSRRNPQVIKTDDPMLGMRAMNDYAGNIGAFTLYDENGTYHSTALMTKAMKKVSQRILSATVSSSRAGTLRGKVLLLLILPSTCATLAMAWPIPYSLVTNA